MEKQHPIHALIIGGGAAGFFAAITCAEALPGARVVILEKGRDVLQKVKVSGGGRCNVTHACFEPGELVKNYPRGSKALLGPFHRFGPTDTVEWFGQRGVRLKTEADGRMFPVSDRSQTIMDCLTMAAEKAGVEVFCGQNAAAIAPPADFNSAWKISTQYGGEFLTANLMIAAGSSPRIWQMLEGLGHRIVPPVPSLFTFHIKDARIHGLAGVAVQNASVNIPGTKLATNGPLLITHWGMSGPAILRLSAWGARHFFEKGYQVEMRVNWLGNSAGLTVVEKLQTAKVELAKKTVKANCPFQQIPKRLWESIVLAVDISETNRWADLNKKTLQALGDELSNASFQVNGKSTFKEEFVTAGGVHLDEVDFKTFGSKVQPRLFLAGEVLDIDAVTGGFNFQAAWTGGYLAGKEMGRDV